MGAMIKMFSALIILNIFMYLGVNFSISYDGQHQLNEDYNFFWEGDLIDTYMRGHATLDEITQNTKENWTSYGMEFNSSVTTIPDQTGGTSVGVGGISFLDTLKIVYPFVRTLGNVAIAPLTLFFNFRMPVFVGLMIGVPWFIIFVLTIIFFIRGVNP